MNVQAVINNVSFPKTVSELEYIVYEKGGFDMEPRLITLDFQLFHNLLLLIITLIPLFIILLVIFLSVRCGKKRKSNCDNCPYNSIDNKER